MSKPSLLYNLRMMLKKEQISYDKTREQYMRDIKHFADYCKTHHGCRKPSECKKHMQEYADFLAAEGKSDSTIHTYLAPVCKVFHINMKEIKKPLRHLAENTRSRGNPEVDKRKDAKDSCSPRLAAFADVVGIRRHEYARLRGRNFIQDESGYWCVEVERGKGGKYHRQRIPEDKVAFIKSYFDAVGPDDYVFTKEELNNKIDLHNKRGKAAKREYRRYVELFKKDPKARRRVYKEICARWDMYNSKQGEAPPFWKFKKPYVLRGKNRELALKNGWDISYDRLALMAVSVFHLSHWRVDVTVANYLLK